MQRLFICLMLLSTCALIACEKKADASSSDKEGAQQAGAAVVPMVAGPAATKNTAKGTGK